MEFLSSLKDYQIGSIPGWGLLFTALGFWWKGLPSLIEAWEKRSAGIENRLQAAMTVTLDRYEIELKHFKERLEESDAKHKECEDRAQKQSERINHLERDVIGFQRQIAAQDIAKAGHLNMENSPATAAAIERLKIIK